MNEFHSLDSDGQIVADCLSGQSDRFDELVRRYRPALVRVAHSRLGNNGAEDVVQETFLSALKSLHTYDSRWSFRTWLWTILLNHCRRYAGRLGRGPRVRSWQDLSTEGDERVDAFCPASEEPSPPGHLLAKERSAQLARLLGDLPEEQADALRLRFFGQLKFPEIAAAMGCSLSSAKNRVRWGLLKMSRLLAAEESTRPARAVAVEPGRMP